MADSTSLIDLDAEVKTYLRNLIKLDIEDVVDLFSEKKNLGPIIDSEIISIDEMVEHFRKGLEAEFGDNAK